jgi:hypothetical protein
MKIYLCGSKIRNITKGTEAITNGYDGSLISSEDPLRLPAFWLFFILDPVFSFPYTLFIKNNFLSNSQPR